MRGSTINMYMYCMYMYIHILHAHTRTCMYWEKRKWEEQTPVFTCTYMYHYFVCKCSLNDLSNFNVHVHV